MKNRIAIFGGNMFANFLMGDQEWYWQKNKMLLKLEQRYTVDNFSSSSLDSGKALRFMKTFMNQRKYQQCILALGEADIIKGDTEEFKNNLTAIIHELKERQVCPLLIGLSNEVLQKENALEFQEIIHHLAKEEGIPYLQQNVADTEEYTIKNETQMRRAVLNSCL